MAKHTQAEAVPQAISDTHELIRWLIPVLDRFPRTRRFTLGDRLENACLDVLQGLVSAAYRRRKQTQLQYASDRLNIARHLWRLCFELKVIPIKHYTHGAKLIANIGAQIGGWKKHASVKI